MDALSAVTVNEPQQSSDPDVLVSHLGLAACMGASTDSMSQDFQRSLQSQEESSAGSGQTPLSGYDYKSPTSPSNKPQPKLSDEFYDESVQVNFICILIPLISIKNCLKDLPSLSCIASVSM